MGLFQLLHDSENTIYLLSSLSSVVFALVIYSLLSKARILQAKQWATPFADTFFLLGVLYLLFRISNLRFPPPLEASPTDRISVLIFLCSGLTNYLFLLSAFLMSAQAMNQQRVLLIKKWFAGRPYVRSPLLWIFCAIALLGVASSPNALGDVAKVPDAIVSVFVLLLMGIALYKNRGRSDKAMAWLALLSSVAYAVVYVLTEEIVFDYLFLPSDLGAKIKSVIKPLSGLGLLVLKFGFFFSGYSLMLSISGPLQGIVRLLANVLHKEKEYLESNGIVRSIHEELALNRVRLFIKLPGSKERQIALYEYPPSSNGNQPEPQILTYRAGEIYDHVMTSGTSYREHRENSFHWLFPATYKIGVPVFFHDSVIACLEAQVGRKTFTEGNRINLERLANLISPAVQTYREMSALNKLSQDLAQLQIGVVEYRPAHDVKNIVEIIQNVVSPSAAGVSVEIGFSEYSATYAQDKQLDELIEKLLGEELGEEDFKTHNGAYRWLNKGLTISPTDSTSDDQVFGKFILGIERGNRRVLHPTIGTNPTCRRALSDLLTDTLLDFVRGHLNQVTDNLSVQLSGLKVTTTAEWRSAVETMAKDAGLLWAVASSLDEADTFHGTTEMVELVKGLELPDTKKKWQVKADDLWLCRLKQPNAGTHHVIRAVLRDSKNGDPQATLWLGVARREFGRELDYMSPWKFFLDHFCEIASSALLRIRMRAREETRIKNLAFLNTIMSDTVSKGNMLHSLRGATLKFADQLKKLELYAKDDQFGEAHKELILSLEPLRSKIETEIESITSNVKRNKRRPCSLDEAIAEACKDSEALRLEYGIKINEVRLPGIPAEAMVDVPFNVARYAIKTVVDNAVDELKEAIENGIRPTGEILVELRLIGKKMICDIRDNGRGVSPSVAPVLLKDIAKSSKPNSNGVGLYLSRAWLIPYDGELVFPAQDPRTGAHFRIEFPKEMNGRRGTGK